MEANVPGTQKQLQMVWSEKSRECLPALPAPEDYEIASLGDGDEPGHIEVMHAAGFDSWSVGQLESWRRHALPDGIFLIRHTRSWSVVATAMATHRPTDLHPSGGELGWVAASPEHSGRGLGAVVCAAALRRFVHGGYGRVYLKTDDARFPAIKTYLRLGFVPFLHADDMEGRWEVVYGNLGVECDRGAWLRAPESLWKHADPHERPDSDRRERYVGRYKWLPERVHRGYSGGGDVDAFGDESLYRPSRLGKAGVAPSQIRAGESAPLQLTFTAGEVGVPEGTRVSFAIRGQHPLGSGPNGFAVDGPAGCTLETSGHGFILSKGSLSMGERVTLTSEPFEWTPLAGRRELKVVLSYGNGRPEQRLPEPLTVDILPLAASRLEAMLPCTFGADFDLSVRICMRDVYDNRVPTEEPMRVAVGDEAREGRLAMGTGTVILPAPDCKSFRVHVQSTDSGHTCTSNPCIRTDGQQLYIGDLHCHDYLSEAEAYPDEVYRWAIEDRRLDFVSVVPQSHGWHDNETWTVVKYMNERYLREGEFVPFLGFEWQHTGYGDKVVHFLGGDQPYLPVDDPRYNSAPRLYEALRGSDALVISHHPCYPAGSWCSSTDFDTVEADVERLVEIWSMHGSCEGYDPSDRPLRDFDASRQVMAALRKGLRVGFTAGSDTHSGRPGGSMKEPREHWGGLTAVWADGLTRRDLFQALHRRRTYALTRARIVLEMTVNGEPMGSEILPAERCGIRIDAWAPGDIRSVEVLKNTAVLRRFDLSGDECHVEVEDIPEGAAFYHCRVVLADGNLAVCSPVWVG